MTFEKLMTSEEVAELLSIAQVTLDRLRKNGDIDHVMVGGQVRFEPSHVRLFLQRNTKSHKTRGAI
jgi:excisionase family DNA binding protein